MLHFVLMITSARYSLFFLKIQSCEGQNVRHIRRKYEKGAQVQ